MERIDSGIKNLNRLLGGGIPRQQMILVEGEPGSGKTNLGLEFLYRGAQRGETGLYVSFQDSENEILRTTTFDWNFKEKVEKNTINIANFDPYRYEKLADMLRSTVVDNDAKRVVLDPITDLDLYIDSRKDQRKNLLEVKRELKNMECTTMLMAEKEESTEIEREVADGIVEMSLKREEDELVRQIFVKKLKGSDFTHSVHNYTIQSDGIRIR